VWLFIHNMCKNVHDLYVYVSWLNGFIRVFWLNVSNVRTLPRRSMFLCIYNLYTNLNTYVYVICVCVVII